jgi:hypothetical protein
MRMHPAVHNAHRDKVNSHFWHRWNDVSLKEFESIFLNVRYDPSSLSINGPPGQGAPKICWSNTLTGMKIICTILSMATGVSLDIGK